MSITVAHTGDLHFHEPTLGELKPALDQVIDESVRAQAVALLVAGDVFEGTTTPPERFAFADFLSRAANEVGRVVVIRGNHDPRGELDLYGMIDSGVFVRSSFDVVADVAPGLTVVCCPWASGQEIERSGGPAGVCADVRAAIADPDLVDRADEVVVVAHLEVGGYQTEHGQVVQGRGRAFAAGDLATLGAGYVALGHIHLAQEWADGAVAYSGSPIRHTFGEPSDRSFVLATVGGRRLEERRRVALGTPRRDTVEFAGEATPLADVKAGDHVKVRVRLTADAAAAGLPDGARAYVERLEAAGVRVTVEPSVSHAARERVAGFGAARTIDDKLRLYLEARGEGAMFERLVARLAMLRAEPTIGGAS